MLVVSGAVDAEAVIGRRNGVGLRLLLVLSSLDGFVVENDLSQFILVVRRLRSLDELAWVFLVGVECLLEVRPVGQAFPDCLLGGLCVVQALEAVQILDSSSQDVDVGQWMSAEPSVTHKEVALVVQFP